MSPLPLCRIPTRVQNGEYDDDISFHREVHDVGKASKQRAADSGSDPESSGDRRRHVRAARGWDRGDTRQAALQQGSDATLSPRGRVWRRWQGAEADHDYRRLGPPDDVPRSCPGNQVRYNSSPANVRGGGQGSPCFRPPHPRL